MEDVLSFKKKETNKNNLGSRCSKFCLPKKFINKDTSDACFLISSKATEHNENTRAVNHDCNQNENTLVYKNPNIEILN